MKKILSAILVAILCLSLLPANTTYAAVKISKAKATMEVDSTLKLKVTGTNKEIKWSSSKKSVATVSKSGTVTAKSEGQAIITATINKNIYTCEVTVVNSNKLVKSVEEFQDYLNDTYRSLKTDMGKVTLKHTVMGKFSDNMPFDITINTDWDGISPYDIEYSSTYTDEEKENTIKALINLQESIYKDAIDNFPVKKIDGGYIMSWYDYPSIMVGYNSIRFLSWNNYSGVDRAYKNTKIDKFKWIPEYDDYDFTK